MCAPAGCNPQVLAAAAGLEFQLRQLQPQGKLEPQAPGLIFSLQTTTTSCSIHAHAAGTAAARKQATTAASSKQKEKQSNVTHQHHQQQQTTAAICLECTLLLLQWQGAASPRVCASQWALLTFDGSSQSI